MRSADRFSPMRLWAQSAGLVFAVALSPGPSASAGVLDAPATNVVGEVSAQVAGITNLRCVVRREVPLPDGRVASMVSKVDWARGDRLHVETTSPETVRTVIDGKTVVRIRPGGRTETPLGEQTPGQAANLRSVPGSAEEYLSMFDPLSALDLPDSGELCARRVAFAPAADGEGGKERRAVVSFDEAGRILRIEFFADAERARLLSILRFEAPVEPLPGAFLYRRIEAESPREGLLVRTLSRFDSIRVNQDLPCGLFDPSAY
ncbi:MAG: LolA family protein [Kiritimatiellia bacterium]|jgi:hypothetical protein